jgi:hypothetical protein
MKRHRIPKVRLRNHIVTLKEEKVSKGDKVVVENIFLEEEEKVKEEK